MSLKEFLALLLLGALPSAAHAHLFHDPYVRVYVIVIEGLEREEVGAAMPTLAGLRAEGAWYENANAVMPSTTLVNHAALMTGVLPRRNGIVGESFLSADGAPRAMDSPDLLEADTLVTRLKEECLAYVETATILSRPPLYNLFKAGGGQRQADFHQRPFPGIEREPDWLGMQDFANWALYQPTPQFGLLSLGDGAEAGSIDPAGVAGISPARLAVLAHADAQIRYLIENLKALDFWKDTILFVVSDHGMDWSLPGGFVSLTPTIEGAGLMPDEFTVVADGAAAMVYVHDPARIETAAAAVRTLPGVGTTLTATSTPSLADYGLDHPNTGQIVAFAAGGSRFSDPSPIENPYPGNSGNSAAQPTVLLVSGGHAGLVGGATSVSTGGQGPMSIAATVAALFGLAEPPGGYDGTLLTEAFDPNALTSEQGPCAP